MVEITVEMMAMAGLFILAVAGWATVYAQRRALLEARKAFQMLGMKPTDAEELTDVDYQGQDIILAMETVLLAMKANRAKAEALKAKPKPPVS
jgi:hypothetical protein